MDASQAGEGQLEISINDGEVPNHVQVLGGGKCLVSFTPEIAKSHSIEIKFNGETVPGEYLYIYIFLNLSFLYMNKSLFPLTTGCPFVCKIADTSRVSVSLRNMELVAAGEVAKFDITVDGTANSELAVSVKGKIIYIYIALFPSVQYRQCRVSSSKIVLVDFFALKISERFAIFRKQGQRQICLSKYLVERVTPLRLSSVQEKLGLTPSVLTTTVCPLQGHPSSAKFTTPRMFT